ncbi:hypothetical protein Tco_0920146 [Tanacetum coccineum]
MVYMVPHEAFACRCAEGDVVLRQSINLSVNETRLRKLISSPGAPSTPCYSAGHSTPLSYSQDVQKTPPRLFSDLQHLQTIALDLQEIESAQLQALAWKISVHKATMEMHMHPEQHTVNSAALFYEVLNEMEKLDLE